MISDEEFAAANAAGAEKRRTTPRAVRARYDRHQRRVVVRLNTGLEVSFSPRDVQGLEQATPEQLADIVIEGPGYGLHWPGIDADVDIAALLQGVTGNRHWMKQREARSDAA